MANPGTGRPYRTYDNDIVATFGAEYRGIVGYYLLASDVWRLSTLHWYALTSCRSRSVSLDRSTPFCGLRAAGFSRGGYAPETNVFGDCAPELREKLQQTDATAPIKSSDQDMADAEEETMEVRPARPYIPPSMPTLA